MPVKTEHLKPQQPTGAPPEGGQPATLRMTASIPIMAKFVYSMMDGIDSRPEWLLYDEGSYRGAIYNWCPGITNYEVWKYGERWTSLTNEEYGCLVYRWRQDCEIKECCQMMDNLVQAIWDLEYNGISLSAALDFFSAYDLVCKHHWMGPAHTLHLFALDIEDVTKEILTPFMMDYD